MTDSCNVLLVSPQFNAVSFWSYKKSCEIAGIKYPTAPLGLITVAALLPPSWTCRLIDRNAQELTEAALDWADLVMTGGMLTQQQDLLNVVARAHAHGKPIAVGGSDPTSSPHIYKDADFLVLGEAELVMDALVDAWRRGERKGLFEAEKFSADVAKSPIPRYDLLNFKNYFYIGLQFSRGCPFNCEFCDIIELFGRVPRAKTNEQVLAELDTIYGLGYRGHVDFVDDNLIGNKKALRKLLPEIIAWQKARNYPFLLSTEASINLADDDALLKQLREANFFAIYVGIESPDSDTLIATQKKQNTKRSLSDSLNRIYDAGIMVVAGFIVGFDEEKGSVADGIVDLIESAPVAICMVSQLYALPNTQLTRRLEKEGRLHSDHDRVPDASILCTAGLNFETKRPRRDVFTDFRNVLARVYDRKTYFRRLRRAIPRYRYPTSQDRVRLKELLRFFRISWSMTWNRELCVSYWSTFFFCVMRNPGALNQAMTCMMLYAHLGPFSRYVIAKMDRQIEAIDAEARAEPPAPRLLAAVNA